MFLRWLKNRRRAAILGQPFPQAWLDVLRRDVWLYDRLTVAEQARMRDYLQIFVAEKNWEGCNGFEINDDVRVTIAAEIAILTLGFVGQYFDNVLSILVYPRAYVARGHTVTEGGFVLEGNSPREGEAWYRGPVVLSWAESLAGTRHEARGRNVVLHEFAHQLDMLNGRTVDGMPPLESTLLQRRWSEVMSEHYQTLVAACESGDDTLLDCYGATSPSEFFAVATETFFERPRALGERHPAIYDLLRDFYRQDPAARDGTD